MGSEPQFSRYPNLSLAQHIFSLANTSSPTAASSRQSSISYIENAIRQDKMAPLYRHLCHPTEGVLNSAGETSSSAAVVAGEDNDTTSPKKERRASLVASNLLPPRRPGRTDLAQPSSMDGVGLEWKETMYEELQKNNEEELAGFQKEEDEAQENAGEVEIQAARGKRAEFWARVGDKVSQHLHKLCMHHFNKNTRTKQPKRTKQSSKRQAR